MNLRCKTLLSALAASALLASFGCSVQYGRKPPTKLLEQNLTPQHATKQDVLDTLGAPRGYGVISLPDFDGRQRAVWYYEFSDARTDHLSSNLLLVFFDHEKYDGYLYYASDENIVQVK